MGLEPSIRIVPVTTEEQRRWLAADWRERWGDETMITRGRLVRVDDLHALIAKRGAKRVGEATYRLDGDEAELTSISAAVSGQGIGSALLAAVEAAARAAGAVRLALITTNDNLEALHFHQRRGYRLVALHPGAIDAARRLKPTIPEVGDHAIPIRDELVLEKRL